MGEEEFSKEVEVLFDEIKTEVHKGKAKSFHNGFKEALVKTLEITKEAWEEEKSEIVEPVTEKPEMAAEEKPSRMAQLTAKTPAAKPEGMVSQKLEEVMMQQKKTQELVNQLITKTSYIEKASARVSNFDTRINSLELMLEQNKEFVNEKISEFKTDFDNNLRAFNENLYELTTQVSDLRNKISMSMGEEEEERPHKAPARR